jgi:hypothetical protein
MYRSLGREAGTSWGATVRDLSCTGASLLMEREVRPGTVLVVALEGSGGRFARPLLMRIIYVRPAEGRRWQAGCKFVMPLTNDDVEAMLLAEDAGEPTDPR